MFRSLRIMFVLVFYLNNDSFADNDPKIPSAKFQGEWKVKKVTGDSRSEIEDRRLLSDDRYYEDREIRFRVHESGSIQQVWHDAEGKVIKSRGIEIKSMTNTELTYREWRFHKVEYKTLTLLGEGRARLDWHLPKEHHVYELISIEK